VTSCTPDSEETPAVWQPCLSSEDQLTEEGYILGQTVAPGVVYLLSGRLRTCIGHDLVRPRGLQLHPELAVVVISVSFAQPVEMVVRDAIELLRGEPYPGVVLLEVLEAFPG
jgi:hypothetical protein